MVASASSGGGGAAAGGMHSMTATLNMRAHMTGLSSSASSSHTSTHHSKAKTGASGVPISNAQPPLLDANNKTIIPLSARFAEPLDLSTVERRGQPTQVQDVPKKARHHGLQEAPTFRPTEEEFRNPMEYIRKIAPRAREYGICKIIPPDGWNPDFAIDTQRFHFRTRKQKLNLAEGDTRANLNYLDQLSKFHMARNGTNLNRFPSVDKRPLDLYKLKKFVEDKGGFDAVCRQKRWAEIGRDLGYSGKIMSSLSTSLKNSYQKWLQPYEDWLRYNKPSILQQQEIENGGPYTPSPVATPAKSQQHTPNVGTASPTVRASSALNAALQAAGTSDAHASKPSNNAGQAAPPASSGFTAVNTGGFTAVNARPPPQPTQTVLPSANQGSTLTAANGRKTDTAQSTPQRSEMSPLTSMENTPDAPHMSSSASLKGATPSTPALNQMPNQRLINALKRNLPSDQDHDTNGDGSSPAGGRSKRARTDSVPVVAGSSMVQPRLPAPRLQLPRDRSKEKPGDLCEECGRGDDETAILICDNCDSGYHRYCLRPPLKSIPEQDWYCPRCLFGRGEYGFEEGAIYSLRQFQERAREFKEKHFHNKVQPDPVTGKRQPTEDEVEREFWRLTESLTETVEVEYGADIHSTTHGSAFPTLELHPTNPYSIDPWNLNVLPLDKDSLFRHIKTDISGMTVPWLYVGMCFSTFCWHSEDHYAYSINYQHFGDTKTWYGIPGSDAEKFENAMREKMPEMFEQQPDLLFQLVTLLQPEKLQKAGVRVYALDQRAGQFVITFPQAYHAGFNHGFNFNEAVNFAPADWEPFGAASIIRLQDYRRQPVFCHEELLMSAAARDHSIKTAKWLGPALQRMLDRELKIREDFAIEYTKARPMLASDNGADDDSVIGKDSEFPFDKDEKDYVDDDIVCTYCKAYCYLSRFVCKKTKRVVCLMHAGKFECCEGTTTEDRTSMKDGDHHVQLRLTDEELTATVQKVVDVSRTPEIWNEKLERVLEDGPRAQLKALRSLLAEGDRINQHWDLPQLPELRKYVERCNEWVEEATNYITRKQQNRRKNERVWRKSLTRNAEADEREKELRSVDKIKKLLEQAEDLAFDCPELETLQDRADKIEDFRRRAAAAFRRDNITTAELELLIEESRTFGVDMPEIETLETRARRTKWYERANEAYEKFTKGTPLTLQEVEDFIKEGRDVGLPDHDEHLQYFVLQQEQGTFWEQKVKELIAAEPINYAQLDTLSRQATIIPVSKETLAQVDAILAKQREAQEKINSLYQRCKDPEFRNRPKYQEVREAMESLAELNNKPPGTMDLEKEQKRHEDWMRRGKKLFGKANAPLHILLQHMKLVEERNEHCLDLNDEPRLPVEPSSRANSPSGDEDGTMTGTSREVFCICRKPEAGMMIECEMCHEWYHGKCLKIARGKVKEDDKYTCPICDHRVKIPRDAARPKLEDLQAWQDEIETLPFQPEEEETLENIIDKAAEFRAKLVSIINPIMSTPDDLPVQRFYLRKIEGADVLLADETNFLRQELHKWAPVAPEPPPLISVSLSTRKPRPTKQQKLMAQLGITNPDDLPPHLRPKQPGTKKKEKPEIKKEGDATAGSSGVQTSHTPPGLPHGHSENTPTFVSGQVVAATTASGALRHQTPGHPTFTYDAMAASVNTTSYGDLNSPMFATASSAGSHTLSRPALASPPPQHTTSTTFDPTLDNMFGRPSSSGNDNKSHVEHDGAGFDLASPKQDRSDPVDLFGSLVNEPDDSGNRSPFGGAFGGGDQDEALGKGAFEEGLDGAGFDS
ncbi:hypothetical protein, variant [Verruconis gallopava]|uniref:PLU-1-domain-containing protein n=1 Tax=Verruconis gallopava TaxID=253628 RepID=A0A0D2AJP6_9PEZI|nr:hypothetical protein, variant [Verruconis gallopava]KIW07093.1 hypothetical protein, variant [Verruconis gallopava]